MKVVKTAKFGYRPTRDILVLLESFRQMCNEAIRIAILEKPRNKFELIRLARPRLKEFKLHSHYALSACEVAFAALKNKNRMRVPHVGKPFLKLDNQTYKLNYLILKIPAESRRYIYIDLSGSAYHRSVLANQGLRFGSLTITESGVTVSFSREIALVETKGRMGADLNERNVTWSDSLGNSKVEDTSDLAELKEQYKAIREKIARRTYKDRRISKRLLAKYGQRERHRSVQFLHRVSKRIVTHAKDNELEIVMERLTGIRKMYRRGNSQGTSFRGRMNSWMFGELRRQIEYKALWYGIPVGYVNPKGTSQRCPSCGSTIVPPTGRRLRCTYCDRTWDRDVLASLNIMAAPLVRAALSPMCSREGEPRTQENAGNPRSRRVEGHPWSYGG